MTKYLLIASRDPFEARDEASYYDFAATLGKAGAEVTLFLVQNGVLPARACQESRRLTELSRDGVLVLADELSLRERGIRAERLAPGIEPAALDVVIDQLADGRRAVWF
jgi:sulfur relay (sulfurtransferase) complex TusBCD TusD component (DsrE family)